MKMKRPLSTVFAAILMLGASTAFAFGVDGGANMATATSTTDGKAKPAPISGPTMLASQPDGIAIIDAKVNLPMTAVADFKLNLPMTASSPEKLTAGNKDLAKMRVARANTGDDQGPTAK